MAEEKISRKYSFDQMRSPVKAQVLEFIDSQGEVGSVEVAEELGTNQATASRYLLHYLRGGLLSRRRDPYADKRKYLYFLTANGKRRLSWFLDQLK